MPFTETMENLVANYLISVDIVIPELAMINLSPAKARDIAQKIGELLTPEIDAIAVSARKAGYDAGYNRSNPGKNLGYLGDLETDDIDPRYPTDPTAKSQNDSP